MHPSVSLHVITTGDKLINRIVGVAERSLISFQYLDHGARGKMTHLLPPRPSERNLVIHIGSWPVVDQC